MESQDSSNEDYLSEEEEHNELLITSKKSSGKDVFDEGVESGEELSETEVVEPVDTGREAGTTQEDDSKNRDQEPEQNAETSEESNQKLRHERLERLKKLRAVKKSKHKTGVVYMSKIPPYMKPAKLRQVLSRFGELDRLFLKREDEQKHKNRVRGGGNKKPMFEEGWAEFVRKKDAKLCAETLNGNTIGGKKGNFYYDDVMNIKYLSGFKWADLTEQIARENDVRQAKLQLEVSQANKMNAEFIRNVEKSKMLGNIRAKKRENSEGKDQEKMANSPADAHVFKQRRVTTNRADGPEKHKQASSQRLDNVIKNLF